MKDAEDEAFDELAKRQGHWGGGYQAKKAMAADKLQEPAQEPVAWRWGNKKLNGGYEWRFTTYKTQPDAIPLYAAPPQRPWVGLTEEDLKKIWYDIKHLIGWYSFQESAQAVEAKLKEKNG